ncbi:hypothetical protein FNF27_05556 [Cafeteria roenbergensis]|uniref:Mitochondrial import inner membrane translocase subunit n=1 Tax=Cafeteria roenbergensis TaxID=33653 RepID=A0A5A8C8Q8_CAFRO|nr:hypothetical protein FNF29_06095 [Cafeteria roenbergensis]KAA0168592.1 hypothetical protein FNF31_00472 [Cafeteria roenbergensis]KAA0171127.1 hypothetical protein FNF28_00894 [Cafeteria roenbergensis]KAA0172919.1 hypothetical protein FNF27_05556 [Cafeteria roenbergensis]|eukprot:KAA0149208.1 hypothetical protein FNF29_06095 [Cafeteria roenbergensis]
MDGPSSSDMQQAAAQALQTVQMQAGMKIAQSAFDTCFERCVPTVPSGGKLDHGKQMCLSACTGAYFSVFQVATETVQEKARSAASDGAAHGGAW